MSTSISFKLPGRYKGTRRRREPLIEASCVCGWKSRPCKAKKAEKRYAAHVAIRHAELNPGPQTSAKTLALPVVRLSCPQTTEIASPVSGVEVDSLPKVPT